MFGRDGSRLRVTCYGADTKLYEPRPSDIQRKSLLPSEPPFPTLCLLLGYYPVSSRRGEATHDCIDASHEYQTALGTVLYDFPRPED